MMGVGRPTGLSPFPPSAGRWAARDRSPLPRSFLVSVLYSRAKLASACGGIIYFLSYVPYMYVAIREEVAHDKITAFEKCIAVSPREARRRPSGRGAADARSGPAGPDGGIYGLFLAPSEEKEEGFFILAPPSFLPSP